MDFNELLTQNYEDKTVIRVKITISKISEQKYIKSQSSQRL